jgi:hypothetical protein
VNSVNGRFARLNCHFSRHFAVRVAVFAVVALAVSPSLIAQTIGTGNIVGFVADPQQKPLAGAKVEITDKATAGVIHGTTSSAGLYSSGPIQPGDYAVRIEVKGFNIAHLSLAVHVGNTTRADVTMQVGTEKPRPQTVGGTAVNIEQAGVQSVVDGGTVEHLPISGRNPLDLAQLEPGVQLQDGGVLGASKDGVSSVSVLSRFGRGVRTEVDGVDVTDETTGASTQNISPSAIQEFQLPESLLDLSAGSAASTVNIITRSGSDQIHGAVFGVYRGDQGAAPLPASSAGSDSSFQREQFGANAGGAIIKDKVFLFADAERTQQNLTSIEPFSFPFNTLNTVLSQPYREFDTDERVDWNMRGSTRAFYRFNYFQDSDLRPDGSATSAQQLRNTNNTATNTLGVDFNTGAYAHSLRFEYLKLRNSISDATSGLNAADNPIPGLGINIGAPTAGNCVLSGASSYCGGPSWLAPQKTDQSDKLARYDGSRILGEHLFRYGIAFNRIEAARLADYSAFPQAGTTSLVGSNSADPTSYPANFVTLGNGIGFSTTKSAFGFPGGGLTPDNRIELYVGDRWNYSPRLTLTYGVHYVHDTGRTDSNLGSLPDLNQWLPGLGAAVRNPNLNFAPQFGFAWDAGGNGKTVIRGGAGLFYESTIWNSTLLDNPARLAKGMFADAPQVCSAGLAVPFAWPTSLLGTTFPDGSATVVTTPTGLQALPTFCGETISTAAPAILALNGAYQAAAASVGGNQPNGAFVGTALTALNPNADLFYPNYRTPRSYQMNIGIQKEIRPGTVISADYVRNVGEHYLIGQDVNHSGAARSFNQANAVAARDTAQTAAGCPTGFGQASCMISVLGQAGAQAAYSTAGLDSNLQVTGGGPCTYCAFPGTNPITGNTGAVGGVDVQFPDGRSLYTGVQAKVVTRVEHPFRFVKTLNLQASYALSRFTSQSQDEDSTNLAIDNDDPTRFTGADALSRKHQISFGATLDLPFFTKLSMVGHFLSPLPQSLLLPELTHGGEIFASDWLGTGLGASGAPEPLPATQIGEFSHGININNMQAVLNSYNHVYANNLTPAGACLVADDVPAGDHFTCPGLISGPLVMTPSDMVALGWVMPTVGSVAPYAVGIPWLKSMDVRASWPLKVRERFTVEPSVSVFNVFNLVNSFLPGNLPNASLVSSPNGVLAPNVLGGVNSISSFNPFRAGLGSGTFAMGAPRAFEFGVRVSF